VILQSLSGPKRQLAFITAGTVGGSSVSEAEVGVVVGTCASKGGRVGGGRPDSNSNAPIVNVHRLIQKAVNLKRAASLQCPNPTGEAPSVSFHGHGSDKLRWKVKVNEGQGLVFLGFSIHT
jgi:hypothetical protein